MPGRPKKDGTKVSFYLDSALVERLRGYCEEKGQTMTTALERIVKDHLDRCDEEKRKG